MGIILLIKPYYKKQNLKTTIWLACTEITNKNTSPMYFNNEIAAYCILYNKYFIKFINNSKQPWGFIYRMLNN